MWFGVVFCYGVAVVKVEEEDWMKKWVESIGKQLGVKTIMKNCDENVTRATTTTKKFKK